MPIQNACNQRQLLDEGGLLNLGMDKKATTYVTRHTFSTVLKRSGASTEAIQEALGHIDIKTTDHYLDNTDLKVANINRTIYSTRN